MDGFELADLLTMVDRSGTLFSKSCASAAKQPEVCDRILSITYDLLMLVDKTMRSSFLQFLASS